MDTVKLIITLLISLGLLYWVVEFVLVILITRKVSNLEDLKADNLKRWPKVSIISPAHNEEKAIEQSAQSRIKDDYPDLELILLDDRSTDKTPEIIKKLSEKECRIKPIFITEIPKGWWGKNHAMHLALQQTQGEWILLSDADVQVKPGTLRKAISYCEKNGIDHLTVLAEILSSTFLVDVIYSFVIRQLYTTTRVWDIPNPKSTASGGIGAFSLVRRSALRKINDFDDLKLEVTEDMAIGKKLKRAGVKCDVLNGRNCVSVQWSKTLDNYIASSDRSTFAYWGKFSVIRTFLMSVFALALELFPVYMLLLTSIPYHIIIGITALALNLAASVIVNKWNNRPIWPSFFFPIGIIVNFVIMLRAGIMGVLRGGIRWGGIFYPSDVLKKHSSF